jgi:hypothetical protein
MDMYRILENFDAVNSKQTLTEGRMKDMLHKRADSMSKEEFVADAGEYGMQPEEAVEFWIAVNGDDEELDEERRSEEDWDAQAIAQQKAKLAREKQKIMMQRKISGQDSGEPPVVRDMSEADMEEGNKFAYNVIKAKAAGKKQADLDGDGDMEKVQEVFPGTPEYELRFGKDDASSAFDKKKVSTGTVYSRKHFDEPEAGDDDTPRSAGRPKGTGRKLGAKGPSVASKLLKGKGGLKEHDDIEMVDRGEYDQEGQMARQDLHTMVDAARELHAILASDENLPEWVQSKITKALDYIDTARDYMKSVDAERGEEVNEFAPLAPVAGALGRAAVAGAASGAVQSAMGDDEMEESALQAYLGKKKYGANGMKALQKAGRDGASKETMAKIRARHDQMDEADMAEKAPPGAKAERMVKGIKKSLSKDGHLSDKDRAIAYATAWKAKKAGKVEEEGLEKHSTGAVKAAAGKDRAADKKSGVPANISTAELKAELKRRSQVEEESTDTKDQHAEKAGKKVTKDLEYDMKHKGKDDAKAEKAGKKVTKDIEYDDKKDKEEKVDETTVSGSVAPAASGDAPKKGKGGMQFGQGVYEGQVAESFEKKLGSILNEGMSVNVSTDDTGKKSISVNATDADADALGDMLKMAGLFSSEGYSRACTDCGGIHEAGACGADMVEEELANSPDEVYTDADYMTQTLSGGLNGPKTTGQTTGPVVNRQASRQGVMAEAERVKEQAESRLWNLYKKI